MRVQLILCSVFLSLTCILSAQKHMVITFKGDTSYYDELEVKSSTIVCQNKNQEKVKLNIADVKLMISPWKIRAWNPVTTHYDWKDTTRRCIAFDGKLYTILMENESVYFVLYAKQIKGFLKDPDYYIFRKKDNTKVQEMLKNDTCNLTLKKYFGGTCPIFDEKLVQLRPQLRTTYSTTNTSNGPVSTPVFPHHVLGELIKTYNTECVQR